MAKNANQDHFQKNISDNFNESISSGIFLLRDGFICSCNSRFSQTLGLQVSDIENIRTLKEFIYQEDWKKLECDINKLLSQDIDSVLKLIRLKKPDNTLVQGNLSLSRTISEGKPAVIGTFHIVTDNPILNTFLRTFTQAFEHVNDSVIVTNLNGVVLYVNQSFLELSGYANSDFMGVAVENVFLKLCPSSSKIKNIELSLSTQDKHEFIIRKKDGAHCLVQISREQIRNEEDTAIGELIILKNISEKDRILGEIRRNEYKYYTLFEKMHDAFAFVNILFDESDRPRDLLLLEANKAFGQLVKNPVDQMIGKPIISNLDFLKNIEPNPLVIISQAAAKGAEIRFEVKAENIKRWYSVSVYSPEINYAFLIIHDITSEKNIHEELFKSKSMLQTILDNIPQRVFWKDVNSVFVGCNSQFAKDMGYNKLEDVVGKTDYDFSNKEDADNYTNIDKKIIESGKPIQSHNFEQSVDHNQKKIWVRLNKLPLRDEQNNIIGIVGTYEDITKQKLIDANFRKLSQAVEQSPVSIVITDLNGNIEYVNKKFSIISGYSYQEVLGKNPRILKSGETSSEAYKFLWQTIKAGNEWTGEFHNRKKNGELYWERATISPIKDDNGTITHYLAVKEDITSQKQAQEALKDNEKLLRETQAIARLGSYTLDIKQNVWTSSAILDDIFGIDQNYPHSIEGWIDLIHPDWRQTMAQYFSEFVLKQHGRFDMEYKIIRKADGAERWVHGLGELELNNQNQPIKMIGTIKDITVRKLAEEALKDSYSLLESTLESTMDGILVVDQDGKIQRYNNKFLEMWRIPNSVIKSKSDDEALNFVLSQLKYPEEFINKVRELYKNISAESVDLLEFKDGRVFERYSRPQMSGDHAVGRVWSFRDITDRKKAEEALIESEKKFRSLFETSIEGILASDAEQKITLVNPRMSELTGYSVEELMGMNFKQLIPADELEKHEQKIDDRKTGKSDVYEKKILRKDGTTIWVLVSATPIFRNGTEYQGSFGMFTDISDKKIAEKQLIVAKEKAEELNRLKSVFLANISHELRTPLIGIIGYAEALYNEIESPEFKEMAYTLLKSGNRLKETLNLILDLSHIEAEKIDVSLSPYNLSKLIRDRAQAHYFAAREKGLNLQLSLDQDDIIINADERLLSQVIEHLIANAIKYTNKGEIVVSVIKKMENGSEYAIIKVKDTGIGISKENLNRIFEPFRQASEGLSRLYEGVGLGLTVAKKFIELMGGEISVESVVNKGSEFTIKFPVYSPITLSSFNFASNIETKNLSITPTYKFSEETLLIEDDEPTANITRFYLTQICRTDWAKDAKTAIEMAQKKNYSIILVDINLGSGMSGIDAIKQIKKFPGYDKIPIVAVTAYALHGDREKFLKQGCTHYIAKPFEKEELTKLVESFLSRNKFFKAR